MTKSAYPLCYISIVITQEILFWYRPLCSGLALEFDMNPLRDFNKVSMYKLFLKLDNLLFMAQSLHLHLWSLGKMKPRNQTSDSGPDAIKTTIEEIVGYTFCSW